MAEELTSERFKSAPMDFVHIPIPGLVYIGVGDRAAFDRIAAPVWDSGLIETGHVLTKEVREGQVTVIFQHWLLSETTAAFLERRKREREADTARATGSAEAACARAS